MNEPLENMYFNWLCAKVLNLTERRNPDEYWNLLRHLHRTEFVWQLSGDDNRAEDGKDLRREFLIQADAPDNPEWRRLVGCSVLEMLIAFAMRAEFQTDLPFPIWFWGFIENLGLTDQSDTKAYDEEYVSLVLEDFIWRTYEPDGKGGLFPLDEPSSDQRGVEIWYQFCEYVVERNIVD